MCLGISLGIYPLRDSPGFGKPISLRKHTCTWHQSIVTEPEHRYNQYCTNLIRPYYLICQYLLLQQMVVVLVGVIWAGLSDGYIRTSILASSIIA